MNITRRTNRQIYDQNKSCVHFRNEFWDTLCSNTSTEFRANCIRFGVLDEKRTMNANEHRKIWVTLKSEMNI